jgi:hypothetical protein
MGPAGVSWKDRTAGSGHAKTVCPDERRLDPGLKRLTDCAAPPELPTYLVLGFPICFTVALGILLIGFRGALTPEAMGFLALGGLGILIVRYLNRHS